PAEATAWTRRLFLPPSATGGHAVAFLQPWNQVRTVGDPVWPGQFGDRRAGCPAGDRQIGEPAEEPLDLGTGRAHLDHPGWLRTGVPEGMDDAARAQDAAADGGDEPLVSHQDAERACRDDADLILVGVSMRDHEDARGDRLLVQLVRSSGEGG